MEEIQYYCNKCKDKKEYEFPFSNKNILIDERKRAKEDYLCIKHQRKTNNSEKDNEYNNKLYYIWYCQSCEQNLCVKCYEEHNNEHKANKLVICLRDINPRDNELNIIKERLEHMSNVQTRIFKLKKIIEEIKNIIDKLQACLITLCKNINSIYSQFNEKYLFNFLVKDSYDNCIDFKMNYLRYNSILNIKQFNYTKKEFPNFYNDYSIGKLKIEINRLFEKLKLKLNENIHKGDFNKIKITKENLIENTLGEILNYQINEMKKMVNNDKIIINEKEEILDNKDNSSSSKISIYEFENKSKINIGKICYNKTKKQLKISINNDIENSDLLFITSNECFQMNELKELIEMIALTKGEKIKIIRKNKIWSFEKDKQNNVINWKEDINITNTSDANIDFIIEDISPENLNQVQKKISELNENKKRDYYFILEMKGDKFISLKMIF